MSVLSRRVRIRFNYMNAIRRKKFPVKFKWQAPGIAPLDEVFQPGLWGRSTCPDLVRMLAAHDGSSDFGP